MIRKLPRFHDTIHSAFTSWSSRPGSKRFLLGFAILGVAMLASFTLMATAPSPEVEPQLEKAWPVSVTTAQPDRLAPVFSTYGRVESINTAELRTTVVAEVAAVHVREGQRVSRDDVLVELRKDELELRAKEKQAELEQQKALQGSLETEKEMLEETSGHYRSVWELAQKKLARQQDLLQKRMIPQAMMDDAVREADQATIAYQEHVRTLADFPNRIAQQKARVAQAESQWRQALINLERSTIRAPFDGPVLSVSVSEGDFSSLGEPLVVIADENGFVVRAPVPNRYAQRLRQSLQQGLPLYSETDLDGRRISFRLDRLGRDVKAGQSGLDAFFVIEDGNRQLGSALEEVGRIINLKVQLPSEQNVVALPVQSIYENDRIYEVREGRLQAVAVERVGEYETADGQYRILVRSSELGDGEPVITTQLPRAISGLLVEPIEELNVEQLAQRATGESSGGSY